MAPAAPSGVLAGVTPVWMDHVDKDPTGLATPATPIQTQGRGSKRAASRSPDDSTSTQTSSPVPEWGQETAETAAAADASGAAAAQAANVNFHEALDATANIRKSIQRLHSPGTTECTRYEEELAEHRTLPPELQACLDLDAARGVLKVRLLEARKEGSVCKLAAELDPSDLVLGMSQLQAQLKGQVVTDASAANKVLAALPFGPRYAVLFAPELTRGYKEGNFNFSELFTRQHLEEVRFSLGDDANEYEQELRALSSLLGLPVPPEPSDHRSSDDQSWPAACLAKRLA